MSSSLVNPSSPKPDTATPVTRTSTEATPVESQTNQLAASQLSGKPAPVKAPKMGNRDTVVVKSDDDSSNRGTFVINERVSDEEAKVSDDAKKSVATSKDVSETPRREVETVEKNSKRNSEEEDFTPSKLRAKFKQLEKEAKAEKEEENRSRSKSDPAKVASPKPAAVTSPKVEQAMVEYYPEEEDAASSEESLAPAQKETPATAPNVENKTPTSTEVAETIEEPKTTSLLDAAKSKVKSCDWYNIATIVAGVVFALFAVFGALCAGGIFPMAFLGGQLGVGFSIVGGVLLMAAAGAIYYYRRESQKMQTA